MNRLLRIIIPLSVLVFAIMFIIAISTVAHAENIPATLNVSWNSRANATLSNNIPEVNTATTELGVSGTIILTEQQHIYLPVILSCHQSFPQAIPLVNGDFEQGSMCWTFSPNGNAGVVTSGNNGIIPHIGNKMASVISTGVIGDTAGYMEQKFTVPESIPYMSFWWASVLYCGPVSGGRCGGDLSMSVDGTPITSAHVSGEGGGTFPWKKIVVDLFAYRNSTVTFRFSAGSYRDGIYNYIDDITFTNPPLPLAFEKTSPEYGATSQPTSPTLTWDASGYAASYQYCIDTTDDNACNTAWISTGTDNFVTLSGLTVGTYFWQVRATNSTGSTYADGSSTAYWSFNILPIPSSLNKLDPTDGSTNLPRNITVSWTESINATSYEICLDTTNDDTCTTVWVSILAPYNSFNAGYLTAATYYWQVRAVNGTGMTYADGETTWWSFTISPVPGTFNKLSPVDDAINQPSNLTLSWEASSDALSYGYCIGWTDNNPCGTAWIGIGTSTSVDIVGVSPGIYYWQVVAQNNTGETYANGGSNPYDTAAWWSFTVP
jgi:hypothetical protein